MFTCMLGLYVASTCERARVRVLFIGIVLARDPMCVCVCVCVCARARAQVRVILCACVFAMLCMKMFVNFRMFCMLVYHRFA